MSFKVCFATPFFSVETSDNLYEDQPYYRIVNGDGVILGVLDCDDQFVLVRQFRPNLGYKTLEFPAGGMEDDETPLEAAKRELIEETGVTANFIYLGPTRLQMNRMIHIEHLFFGITYDTTHEREIPTNELIDNEPVRIDRKVFFRDFGLQNTFEHLAAFGLVQKTSLLLNVDLTRDSFESILSSFKRILEHQKSTELKVC
jgi:8-oxo-dGTP pyrophosphatase MutT (NUDIX family)